MKNKLIYIVLFLLSVIIIFSVIIAIKFSVKKVSEEPNINEYTSIEEEPEEILIIGIEKNNNIQNNKTEEKKEEVKEETKEEKNEEPKEEKTEEHQQDPATLTQKIYNMNSEIGTLYIPRTGLTTSVYSNSSVSKMEKMPCFLYTTGGLNKPGATLIVGHNKRNGKLFSNNKKIQEGDEFYFKDYEGKELKYVVYSKFITTDGDMSFLISNETNPVIALSCCTDANDENRIIVLGRAEI